MGFLAVLAPVDSRIHWSKQPWSSRVRSTP